MALSTKLPTKRRTLERVDLDRRAIADTLQLSIADVELVNLQCSLLRRNVKY